jgi:IS5 family transposase
MFKILILQAWYALSDEVLEKQIARDLMTRESANEFCWVFFQDILGVLWLF